MIKKVNDEMVNIKGVGDFELFCNSCHVLIAKCINFQFEEGQELVYAPLLCEKCGKKINEQLGDLTAFKGMLKKLLSGAESANYL